MLPLWLGVAPFAVAYAVTARAAGLSVLDTQVMSLTLFAGASQFALAGLFGQGAGPWAMLGTVFVLNARHLLYGLSLGQHLPLAGWRRALAAQFLTDEAYGVTVGAGVPGLGYLLGTELSLYLVWNAFTLLGALAGALIPDPERLGVDFVFPLAFLGLLVPLLRGRTELLVALASGALALLSSRLLPGGVTVLLVGVAGALLGAWLSRARAAV